MTHWRRALSRSRGVPRVACRLTACAFAAYAFAACARDATPARPGTPPLFELVSPERSGVTFANELPSDDTTFNVLSYLYYDNGGGVAVGDVDGDGLPDLYFTSNLGGGRLYHNLGNFRFEDVTARAGVRGAGGWTTGATMADVNGDGRLDIYVSGVDYLGKHGHNVLYVNNGDGTFTDRTREYGLEHAGYGTQAIFVDVDGDGDLDAYLLNHSTHTEHGSSAGPQRDAAHPRAGDELLLNEGGHFVDATARAHVHSGVEGYGLGVVASDFDGDGCPDLFVTNDFQENDFLYRNDCDGKASFTERIESSMPHTSRFSMGVDAADFNNDGRPDVMVLDMLPDSEEILKRSVSAEDYVLEDMQARAGYHRQYERNTLELNRGNGRFSDISFAAGVAATDWSWSALFADLDNDGWKDLFITDGIVRRPNDLDYIGYVGNAAVQASLATGITRENLAIVKQMPSVPMPNRAFRNDGDLRFTDMAAAWGLAQPGFSNGAAYVDLDNDGALDLVVNRVGAPAAIYRNRSRTLNGRHFLTVQLRGEGANTGGFGARVTIRSGGMTQLLEEQPTRGFESSSDPRLHFGLGAATRVDSLIVVWPDRRYQVLADLAADRFITLSQHDARGHWVSRRPVAPTTFADVSAAVAPNVKHEEDSYFDYDREPLLPHLLSQEGPALAVADVNGDGLDDIYVGGAKWQPGRVLVQRRDGTFRASDQPAFAADRIAEDVDAVFLDANGDGAPDLYVVSAGNEFTGRDDPLLDRLYINDGRGGFRRDRAALPAAYDNGACVVAGDFDGDGHPDLFVGSRVVGGKYGLTPRSHLLRNDGHGHFSDVTTRKAPGLAGVGMVTAAAWVDYDGDGKLDLVVTGEWMPVRVFHQESGRFVDRTAEVGLAGSEGWWNGVTVADVNGDGRPDLVLGNLGVNSYITASPAEPARLYVGDFYSEGVTKQILTFYKHGVSYPMPGRDELLKVMPELRDRFPTYDSFGAARIDDILPGSEMAKATVLEARDFASAVALNRGGRFELHALPTEAQLAPIFASAAGDFDGDGKADLLVAGNMFGTPPLQGRYDASRGLLLHGRGDGSFVPVDIPESGVDIDGQVRRMVPIRLAGGGRAIAVARNGADLVVLRVHASSPRAATPTVVAHR